jgi:hypothetical protein
MLGDSEKGWSKWIVYSLSLRTLWTKVVLIELSFIFITLLIKQFSAQLKSEQIDGYSYWVIFLSDFLLSYLDAFGMSSKRMSV